MLTIKITGLLADLVGDVSDQVHTELAQLCTWVDVDNFANSMNFYLEGQMYTGVYLKVKKYLEEKGYEVAVEFPELEPNPKFEFLADYRELQEAFVADVVKARFGFAEAPPRTGKTVCMASAVCLLGGKAMIVVEENEPYQQAVRTFTDLTNLRVGELKATKVIDGDVIVTTRQTLMSIINNNKTDLLKLINDVAVIFIDEAHNTQGQSYRTILETFPYVGSIIGWTGTPYTDNGKDDYIHGLVGPVVAKITKKDAISAELILPVTIMFESVPERDYGFRDKIRSMSTYKRNAAFRKVKNDYIINNTDRNRIVADLANQALADGKSVGIVVGQLNHGELLTKLIPRSVLIHGKLKERDDEFKKFKERRTRCIISTLLEEATDVPSMDVLIIAAGGKNKKTLIQRAMRCCTKYPGKKRGYIIVPYDQADFLETHSKAVFGHMKDYAKEHPKNRLYRDGKRLI